MTADGAVERTREKGSDREKERVRERDREIETTRG